MFEHSVVQSLVLARTNLVAFDVKLNAAVAVLQLHKRCSTHNAAAHNASGYANILEKRVVFRKLFVDVRSLHVHLVKICGIRVYTKLAKLVQRVSANLFLFTEFYCHKSVFLMVRIIISGVYR